MTFVRHIIIILIYYNIIDIDLKKNINMTISIDFFGSFTALTELENRKVLVSVHVYAK